MPVEYSITYVSEYIFSLFFQHHSVYQNYKYWVDCLICYGCFIHSLEQSQDDQSYRKRNSSERHLVQRRNSSDISAHAPRRKSHHLTWIKWCWSITVCSILVFELEVLNLMNFIIVGFPQSEHRSAFQFQFQFQFHNVVNVTSYHGLLFALQFYDIRLHLLFIFFLCFNSIPQYRI